jgi:mRNA-degrading endonuclease toxin of MazEF toxin-antitoxin module
MGAARAPERGDIVWLQLNPQAGKEQAGHHPALVISPKSYNQRVGLALLCPITSRIKGYPFEVELPRKMEEVRAYGNERSDSEHLQSAARRSRPRIGPSDSGSL